LGIPETIGLCFGRFDIIHYGHVNFLKWCRAQCDRLVVGVASDWYCQWRNLPTTNPWRDRADVVRELKSVSAVYCYEKHCPLALWEDLRPDIIFLNPGNENDPVYEKALPKLREAVKVVWLSRTPGICTRDIKDKML